MRDLLTDIRWAFRSLGKSPGFTAVAAVTLALGIGANAAVFSVVNDVLLRPLPYGEQERIVMVWNRWVNFEKTWLSEPELMDYRRGVGSLEALAAFTTTGVNVTSADGAERVQAGIVTPNIFPVLGVNALHGRPLVEGEGVPEEDQVAVLSHGLWRRRFGGDPAAVGRTIEINGRPRTVVGVMPAGFKLPLDFRSATATDLWVPLILNPDSLNSRGSHYLYAVGKLRAGRSAEQASAELVALSRQLTDEGLYPPEMRFEAFGVPLTTEILATLERALWVLLGAVGFVLLIACVNTAGLLLTRAEGQRRDLAVRMALGAGTGRIVRQLLTESLVLALLGGALGLGLAELALKVVVALNPGNIPRIAEVGIEPGVVAFTAAVSILCVVLAGVAPTLQASSVNVRGTLQESGRSTTVGRSRLRLRRALVTAAVSLAIVLLVGAGLMIRSFTKLMAVDPGFRSEGLLTARLSLPQAYYPEPADVTGLYDRLLEEARALPGVQHAGAARFLPLTGSLGDWTIQIEGRDPEPGQNFAGDWQVVTPGYLEAMRIPLVSGRYITDADHLTAPQVILINRTMAEEYWPGDDPLGQRVRFGGDQAPWITIVGVVGDVRHSHVAEAFRRTWYRPHAQFPASTGSAIRAMSLVVRTAQDPIEIAGPVRDVVRRLDGRLPLSEIRTMTDVMGAARAEPRFMAVALSAFAALAAVLAAIGIYGVMAYSVRQRDHEIGIRMALGARASEVLRLVVTQGMRIVFVGLALGLLGAVTLTRVLRGLLYDVAPTDVGTFVAVTTLAGVVALLACYVPALYAARIDPIEALRHE